MKGAYLLVVEVCQDTTVNIGSLGAIPFECGTYLYTGSAMGGLEARIRRHFSDEKKVRWHIDHLLCSAELTSSLLFESEERIECSLNSRVEAMCPEGVPGFGCSDCSCSTHLHRLRFDVDDLISALGPIEVVSREWT